MTRLQRPVTRETVHVVDGGRTMVVTLQPGDLITMRLKGTRTRYTTTLAACYCLAVKAQVESERRANPPKGKGRRARRRSVTRGLL